MNYSKLGRSGLLVSELGLGGWTFGREVDQLGPGPSSTHLPLPVAP